MGDRKMAASGGHFLSNLRFTQKRNEPPFAADSFIKSKLWAKLRAIHEVKLDENVEQTFQFAHVYKIHLKWKPEQTGKFALHF
jgi:hypothetical protein